MKRISQQANYAKIKTTNNLANQTEFLRKNVKRHQTTIQKTEKKKAQNYAYLSEAMKKYTFYASSMVIDQLITDILSTIDQDIERIQIKKIITSTIQLTNKMTKELVQMQNPENSLNQPTTLPERQPFRNLTDPISGFNKQSFIKKQLNKKHSSSVSHQNSLIIAQKQTENTSQQIPQKKLPPLMKQLSEQKLQKLVPLDQILCMRNANKKQTQDIEQLARQKYLKQLDNKRLKEKIQKMNNKAEIIVNENKVPKKSGSRSAYDLGASADRPAIIKEECNFDYDGNKIQVSSISKAKSNIKILKPLCKLNKQKPQDSKPSKLNKKFHERISFVPRGSRNSLQFNTKIISDFDNINHTLALKEKLESQLRKTDLKFVQKQFHTKERYTAEDNKKPNNRRQSLLNIN